MLYSIFASCLVISGITIVVEVEGKSFDVVSVDDILEGDEGASTPGDTDTNMLPAFFDARLKWSLICPMIGEVKNQGTCKSGWAIAISSVISDRMCINSHGDGSVEPLSARMLLSCCPDCCGCNGGHVLNAWRYVRDVGLASGTMHPRLQTLRPKDGCQPYLIKPLSRDNLKLSSTQSTRTPLCENTKCTNPRYKSPDDKLTRTRIAGFKLFSRRNPRIIMRELMENGPLQVSFRLFKDFRKYNSEEKCSIYYNSWGKNEGAHAAKLIGWGTKNEVKYWILLNSFGRHWGCNGTFNVPRKDLDFLYAIVAPILHNGSPVMSVGIRQWTIIVSSLCTIWI